MLGGRNAGELAGVQRAPTGCRLVTLPRKAQSRGHRCHSPSGAIALRCLPGEGTAQAGTQAEQLRDPAISHPHTAARAPAPPAESPHCTVSPSPSRAPPAAGQQHPQQTQVQMMVY